MRAPLEAGDHFAGAIWLAGGSVAVGAASTRETFAELRDALEPRVLAALVEPCRCPGGVDCATEHAFAAWLAGAAGVADVDRFVECSRCERLEHVTATCGGVCDFCSSPRPKEGSR